MKKITIALTISIGFATLAFTFQQKTILGRWETKMPDHTIAGIIYKADHTYRVMLTKRCLYPVITN